MIEKLYSISNTKISNLPKDEVLSSFAASTFVLTLNGLDANPSAGVAAAIVFSLKPLNVLLFEPTGFRPVKPLKADPEPADCNIHETEK